MQTILEKVPWKNMSGDKRQALPPRMKLSRTRRGTSLYSRTLEWSKDEKKAGRKLFGPEPISNFGPKATIRNTDSATLDHTQGMIDPTTLRLDWKSPPKNVLIIKKHFDSAVTTHFINLASWLIKEKNMTVFVEHGVTSDSDLLSNEEFSETCLEQLKDYTDVDGAVIKKEEDLVDLVICLGGDGTLIHVSSLFQDCCPPVIAFHLGSLGFLTQYNIKTFEQDICGVLAAEVGISLRSRLKCQVRALNEKDEDEVEQEYLVLNEVTFDRGQTTQVANMDIYCNGRHLTSLIGDGLIISTPTGSTAYSMSAGASLVHPSVPGIILTPLCPHSLSFRPIVLPAGVELKIMVANESRNRKPMCAFDGRQQEILDDTKYLRVTTSVYPIPCVSREDHLTDWFNSLAECLNWNRRETKRVPNMNSHHGKHFPNGVTDR